MSLTDGVLTLLPAPDGYVVDFENPQRNLGLALHLISGIGIALSTIFAFQNFYTRWWIQRRWADLSSACLLACLVISVTCQALVIRWYAVMMLGVHAWEMPLDRFILFLKSFTIVAVIFNAVHCTGKLSVLFYYYNLSPQKWWKWTVRSVMFMVFSYCTILFFTLLFACTPMEKSWDVTMLDGTCLDRQAIWLATASMGFISDLILLSLPFFLVLGLQMKKSQKIGILVMFIVGSATFVTSIVRLYLLLQPSFSSPDQTWEMMTTILWAMVELNLIVICPSMFTIRAFSKHFAPNMFSMDSSAKASAGTSGRLRTFGETATPKRRYDKYGQLVEDHRDIDLTQLGCAEPTEVTIEGKMRNSHLREKSKGRGGRSGSPSSDDTDVHNRTWDARPDDENDVERAIIQTKTVEVRASIRRSP